MNSENNELEEGVSEEAESYDYFFELATVGDLSFGVRECLASAEIGTLWDLLGLTETEARKILSSNAGYFTEIELWLDGLGFTFDISRKLESQETNESWFPPDEDLSISVRPIETEISVLKDDSVSVLRLSERPSNCLANAGISTISELLTYSENDLLALRNFGQGSLNEIIIKLDDLGLVLGNEESQATWASTLAGTTREPTNASSIFLVDDSVSVLRLSERPSNCLANAGISTISELLTYSENDLLALRSFGQGSLNEIIIKLDDLGLVLGNKGSQHFWASTLAGTTREPPPELVVIPEIVLDWADSFGFETIGDLLEPTEVLSQAPTDVIEAIRDFLAKPVPSGEDRDFGELILRFVDPETRDGNVFLRKIVNDNVSYRALGAEYGRTAEAMRRNANRVKKQKTELLATDEYRLLRNVGTYLVSLVSPFVFEQDLKEKFLSMGVDCVCQKYRGQRFSGICCEVCHEYVELRHGDEPSVQKTLEEVLTKFDLDYESDQGVKFREVIWWVMEEISGMVMSEDGFLIVNEFALHTASELVLAYREDGVVDEDELRRQFKEAHIPTCPIQDEVSASLIGNDFRQIEGRYCYLAGNVADKAVTILKLKKVPLTSAEITELIGESHTPANLQNRLPGDYRFVRTDRYQRYALRDWGMEEYSGIFQEICERIERGDGVASVEAIIEEFVRDFGVTENSVRINLENATFVISGDQVRFSERTEFEAVNPSLISGAVTTPDGWGQRFTVTEDNLNGYSFNISNHVAYANGIRPDQSLRVPVNTEPEWDGRASIIWRSRSTLPTTDIGRLRELLQRDFEVGNGIIIVPNPDEVSVYRVEELDEEDTPPDNEEGRFTVQIRD